MVVPNVATATLEVAAADPSIVIALVAPEVQALVVIAPREQAAAIAHAPASQVLDVAMIVLHAPQSLRVQ